MKVGADRLSRGRWRALQLWSSCPVEMHVSLVLVEQVRPSTSRSSMLTLGVEEEFFTVDCGSLLPVAYDDALLDGRRFGRGVISGWDGLEHVERMLKGNGAPRQRRAFVAGGMPAVLEQLRAETEAIA